MTAVSLSISSILGALAPHTRPEQPYMLLDGWVDRRVDEGQDPGEIGCQHGSAQGTYTLDSPPDFSRGNDASCHSPSTRDVSSSLYVLESGAQGTQGPAHGEAKPELGDPSTLLTFHGEFLHRSALGAGAVRGQREALDATAGADAAAEHVVRVQVVSTLEGGCESGPADPPARPRPLPRTCPTQPPAPLGRPLLA